jgi:beta-lactamase superfamily II metal-dependent hydrolase
MENCFSSLFLRKPSKPSELMTLPAISRKKFLWLASAGATLSLGRLASAAKPAARTRWVMSNVSPRAEQADLHLITFPSGRRILMDVGEAGDARGAAVQAIQRLGIDQVDLAVISHFHHDHYDGLVPAIEAGLKVGAVICNPPEKELADTERPWGCDWNDVQNTLRFLESRGIPWRGAAAKDLLMSEEADGAKVQLRVICAYDGINTPVGRTDINDMSIVCRLEHGTQSVLFTGALNHALGTVLAQTTDLAATLIKLPHHGTEATVPNQFYDKCGARAALVPSPAGLWHTDRSKRMKLYFEEHNVPCYVSGMHGDVSITLTADNFSIVPEKTPRQPTAPSAAP